ncbi:MAG: FG-GAP repeat domain-containing protein [Planctomycetota bacterium]
MSALPAPIKLNRFEIEGRDKITEVVTEDLDGDGLKDLVLLLGREVRIHFQRAPGIFQAEPDQRFKIDPRAVVMDLGDVFATGKTKQVAFLREDGVYAYKLLPADGPDKKPYFEIPRAHRVLAAETLLRRPSDDEVRRKEFLRDVDGDGKTDVIVPERTGFGIYRSVGEGGVPKFAARDGIRCPPVATIGLGTDQLSSNLTASYFFANPTIADFDADGKPDIVLAQDDWMTVFRTTTGLIASSPVTTVRLEGVKAFSLDAEKPFELDFTMPLVLRDLNDDRRLDAALTHVGTGTTRVFLNSDTPLEAFKAPARVVRAKGITFLSFFTDLDGDRHEDLILPRMDKIGIWAILKAIVTRSVPVDAQFFYQRKGAPRGAAYPDEPDFERSFEIPIAIHSKGDGVDLGTSVIVSLDGDFDGDGLRDLVNRVDKDKLAIYPGVAGRRGVAESPSVKLEIKDTDDYRFVLPIVEDVNGDGRADIVLRYIGWDRANDRVTVFVSAK